MPTTADVTREKIWELYRKHGTVEAVADAVGLPRHEVSPIIDAMPLRQVFRHKGSAPTMYTDKELLAFLKRAATLKDKGGEFVCGEPLTLPAYHKVAPKYDWPAAFTITQRFGTWEAACKLAKVEVNKSTGPRKGSITVEQCLVALRLCRADLIENEEIPPGGEPSYERYVKWARANSQPSGPTVRSKVGPWRTALEMAYG